MRVLRFFAPRVAAALEAGVWQKFNFLAYRVKAWFGRKKYLFLEKQYPSPRCSRGRGGFRSEAGHNYPGALWFWLNQSCAHSVTHQARQIVDRQSLHQLLAEGKSSKDIATLLGLSIKTVAAHREQLMERLAIRDLPGLVRYAMRTGLVQPEP